MTRAPDAPQAPALVVFARQPLAGRVKTRLCPPFTPAQAADFYAAMLDDVLAESRAFATRHKVALWLAVDPPGAVEAFRRKLAAATGRGHPGVASAARAPIHIVAQRGEGLGARMEQALADAFAAGAAPVLLRSSDSPGLDVETLAAALRALSEAALVLCPDQGGGYVLAGLARPAPGLFAHRMSTASVLDETLSRARARGLGHALLPAGFDIDTAQDLARLRADARAGAAGARSRAWLKAHAFER